jgi:hypothetical protein
VDEANPIAVTDYPYSDVVVDMAMLEFEPSITVVGLEPSTANVVHVHPG